MGQEVASEKRATLRSKARILFSFWKDSRSHMGGKNVPDFPGYLSVLGGGVHGAFTWGVLDRLLEVQPESPSGSSNPPAARSMKSK